MNQRKLIGKQEPIENKMNSQFDEWMMKRGSEWRFYFCELLGLYENIWFDQCLSIQSYAGAGIKFLFLTIAIRHSRLVYLFKTEIIVKTIIEYHVCCANQQVFIAYENSKISDFDMWHSQSDMLASNTILSGFSEGDKKKHSHQRRIKIQSSNFRLKSSTTTHGWLTCQFSRKHIKHKYDNLFENFQPRTEPTF